MWDGSPLLICVGFDGSTLSTGSLLGLSRERRDGVQFDGCSPRMIPCGAAKGAKTGWRLSKGEIGAQSIPLAEELTLTNAELSYLQERRKAYENLAGRTGLDGVRSVTTALIQAERYGTPLRTSLRVMADENRDQRMQAAEQKAAALPPKLTVPMSPMVTRDTPPAIGSLSERTTTFST